MSRSLLPAALALLASCGSTPSGDPSEEACDLPATLVDLAGPGAVDCGVVEPGADGTNPWACAIDGLEAGEPFFVRYRRSGIDSVIEYAIVSDGSRHWFLSQDQYGFEESEWDIGGRDCVDPVVGAQQDDPYDQDDVFGYAILECTTLLPADNHYEVCGDCTPETCSSMPAPFDP